MCIETKLQQKIAKLTNNGEVIARFLVETVEGKHPDAKYHHRMEAAKLLNRCGLTDNGESPHFWGLLPTPEELAEQKRQRKENPTPPVTSVRPEPVEGPTLHDIVSYPIARYIRDRTNEGETLVEALCDVIHDNGEYDTEAVFGFRRGTARPPAKAHHKLAAASEIIRRALGESTRRRKSSAYDPEADIDDADPINGHLAKLIRDKTTDGTEAAELLIRIAENDRYSGDWTAAHRVTAAKELIHRAYDLNYEAVTWEHVVAYKQATDFADEGETLEYARIEADRHALIREYREASASGDEEAAQAAEDRFNNYNRHIKEGKDPEDAMKYASYGPNDPIPDELHTQNPTHPVHPVSPVRPEPTHNPVRPEPVEGRVGAIAATIHTPKLTVPINNRSP